MFCEYLVQSKQDKFITTNIHSVQRKKKQTTKYKVCLDIMSIKIEDMLSSFSVECCFTCSLLKSQPYKLLDCMNCQPCNL